MANPPSAAELQSWHREAATSGKSELQAANALHGQWSPFKFLRPVYSQEGIPCGQVQDIEINSSIRPHVQISGIVHENATFSETLVSSLSMCVCPTQYICFPPPSCENSTSRLHDSNALCKRTNYVTRVFNPFTCPSTIVAVYKLSKAELSVFWLRSQTESTGSTKRCKQPSLTFPHHHPCGQYHC